MATKQQFEVVADKVDIEDLWRAMTKNKFEAICKFAPELLSETDIIEGKEFGLGSVIHVQFGSALPGVEPLKERVIEFDETRHLLSFQGLEGGYLKLGFTHYIVSFKLDEFGGSKILLTTTFTYDLEQNFDGSRLVDDFIKILREYVDGVIKYVQNNNA